MGTHDTLDIDSNEELISKLAEIRARQNHLWMGIVRLVMKHAPGEARLLFRQIEKNDEEITRSIREFYGPE